MALVQSTGAVATSATFSSSVTSGNLVVVHVRKTTTGVAATPTDNKSNTYHAATNTDVHGDSNASQWYAYNVTGGSSFQVTCTNAADINIEEYSSIITSDPLDKTVTADTTTQTSGFTATLTQADELVVGTMSAGLFGVAGSFSVGSGYTANANTGPNSLFSEYKSVSSTAAVEATLGADQGGQIGAICVTYKASTSQIEQEGFRGRNDDGSETGATWLSSQDDNFKNGLTINTRLRFLLNATADPAALAFVLRYKKSTDTLYKKVDLSNSGGTLSGATAGTVGTGGTTSVTVAYPASVGVGDLIIMVVGNRPNANTPADISGWDKFTTTGGAGSEGAGTGVVRLTVYIKKDADNKYDADGTESGNVTVTCTSGTSMFGTMFKFTKVSGKIWSVATPVFGSDSSAGTSWSALASSDPGLNNGDYLLCASINSEDTARAASEAVTALSATFGTMVELVDSGITTGNDLGMIVAQFPVTGGPSAGAPTYTMTMSGTNSANSAGPTAFIRIRIIDAPIVVALSANITAGGQATTALLAAPSGKATSDFVTGRMWDNENGTDTIDITTDDYTELEWCLNAQSLAAVDDVYQFRVYKDATTPLDTYTVTPSWTIGTSSFPIRNQNDALLTLGLCNI